MCVFCIEITVFFCHIGSKIQVRTTQPSVQSACMFGNHGIDTNLQRSPDHQLDAHPTEVTVTLTFAIRVI